MPPTLLGWQLMPESQSGTAEPAMRTPRGRDIVVVGGSEGGIQALLAFVAGLPADLPAAVFTALHTHAGTESRLADMLSRRGPLPARLAIHGEPITPGRIYVAPPDNHLMLRPGHLQVVRGPKENGFRPAVDPLFRTASIAYGPRVIGVVLTGNLDCGTAGLLSIKARGGLALVQDPHEAAVPEMPRSALDHVAIDHVATVADLSTLVSKLVAAPPGPRPAGVPAEIAQLEGAEPGAAAEIVCPICQGKLTETVVGGFSSFRCHVGHSFSLDSVAAEQAEEVERALWASVRALEESARLAGRLSTSIPGEELRRRFAEREVTQGHQAQIIRRLLLTGEMLTQDDAARFADAAGGKS
jgi:two-component system, chemotaxis family, protein-glutamate methylesterase/glutaminase